MLAIHINPSFVASRDLKCYTRPDPSIHLPFSEAMASSPTNVATASSYARARGMSDDRTALCWAAAEGNVSLLKQLVAHGAKVNSVDYDRRTALHIAAGEQQISSVQFLLKHGADVMALDRWGRSPLDCAAESHNAGILQLLEEARAQVTGSSVTSPSTAGSMKTGGLMLPHEKEAALSAQRRQSSNTDILSLFQAVQCGDTEKVKRAWFDGVELDSRDSLGRTSLHIAVENAQVGMIELLLSADVNMNIVDADGRTPMSIALEKKLQHIADLLRNHQKARATSQELLLQNKDFVAQAFDATKRGSLNELQSLVPQLVHPDVQDYDLRTLLHVASAEGFLDVVKYLVEVGANVNLLDRWGNSSLSEAIDFAHNTVARFLISHQASENGANSSLQSEDLDGSTLNSALEYVLRTVTRHRWVLGQVYCPSRDGQGNCQLTAHSIWHRSQGPLNSDLTALLSQSTNPIQMFRKISYLMLLDPGQGHIGNVFSAQQPEWLNLGTVSQSQFFLLPHTRKAGLQTVVSVPMIYKMSAIAVLSWYSDQVLTEDQEELQRIQRLCRSVMILATLRHEINHVNPSMTDNSLTSGLPHVSRFQYCQSLESAITASGDLCKKQGCKKDDVEVENVLPLALEWNLFEYVDRLATAMSSEDHAAVISLLRSLILLLRNGLFDDEDKASVNLREIDLDAAIESKAQLLQRVKYYLVYLHSVSPVEGTTFMEINELLRQFNQLLDVSNPRGTKPVSPPTSPVKPPPKVLSSDCVLCKYNVPGHIHPGSEVEPQKSSKPSFADQSPMLLPVGDTFGAPGMPKSPVLRKLEALLPRLHDLYDQFHRRDALLDRKCDAIGSGTISSSEIYEAIGASHDFFPSSTGPRRNDASTSLVSLMNSILQDSSSALTLEQFIELHKCVLKGDGGIVRSDAAVGYASPRIYRVFLPQGEIHSTLELVFEQLNAKDLWQTRPLLAAYYAFAVLVFYIHPFHDGNGRCARLVGNLIAKKQGFPSLFRSSDKTIQLDEFLQKAVTTLDLLKNTRRARQARHIANRKENTSMWF